MNFIFSFICSFIGNSLKEIWELWRSFSLRTKLGIILFIVAFILGLSAYLYHYHTVSQLTDEINQQKETIAIEDQMEIKQAEENVNKAANVSNQIIKTDSNKFSKDGKHLTNKFCSYYCELGVLDSTCAEWAKETGRRCN